MKRSLPLFVEERYSKCKKCIHFQNDYCLIQKKKGKSGYLFHENGIVNKRSRCPIGEFECMPSLHPLMLNKVIRRLDPIEVHYWTRNSITENNVLHHLTLLYKASNPMPRSEILRRLYLIANYANDYQDATAAINELNNKLV